MAENFFRDDEIDRLQFLPDRYSRHSELKVEVTANGPSEFNFDFEWTAVYRYYTIIARLPTLAGAKSPKKQRGGGIFCLLA